MPSTRQIRFEPPKTSFLEGTPPAYGTAYYNSLSPAMRRVVIKDFLRSLAPIGAAKQDEPLLKIKDLIEEADRIHQYYIDLAKDAIAARKTPAAPIDLGSDDARRSLLALIANLLEKASDEEISSMLRSVGGGQENAIVEPNLGVMSGSDDMGDLFS